jgi:DNA-binding MarR family transcriptional regulator
MRVSAEQVASEVLDVVPAVMRVIRHEMRQGRGSELTVAQFRTLAFLARYPGASLSDAADYLGLALPSMSKLVDGLVDRRLITRETSSGDRRRVNLRLTPRGRAALEAAQEAGKVYLAERLGTLAEAERAAVMHAMQVLRPLFAAGCEEEMQEEPAPAGAN